MIVIDKVVDSRTDEIIGVAIAIDDQDYFISRDQERWSSIWIGEFPPSPDPETKHYHFCIAAIRLKGTGD